MIPRILSSAAAGLAITTALLYLMQILVATSKEIIIEPRPRLVLDRVRLEEPPQTSEEVYEPERPVKPQPVPKTTLTEATDRSGIGFELPATPPARPGRPAFTTIVSDGPLMNIIKVRPQYPPIATSRGIEGTVIVQFDVNAIGSVENVVVIESSHQIFNKAAIEAAIVIRSSGVVTSSINCIMAPPIPRYS